MGKENNRVGGRREQRKRRRGEEMGWRGVEETKAKSKGSRSNLTKIRNKKKHRGIPERCYYTHFSNTPQRNV